MANQNVPQPAAAPRYAPIYPLSRFTRRFGRANQPLPLQPRVAKREAFNSLSDDRLLCAFLSILFLMSMGLVADYLLVRDDQTPLICAFNLDDYAKCEFFNPDTSIHHTSKTQMKKATAIAHEVVKQVDEQVEKFRAYMKRKEDDGFETANKQQTADMRVITNGLQYTKHVGDLAHAIANQSGAKIRLRAVSDPLIDLPQALATCKYKFHTMRDWNEKNHNALRDGMQNYFSIEDVISEPHNLEVFLCALERIKQQVRGPPVFGDAITDFDVAIKDAIHLLIDEKRIFFREKYKHANVLLRTLHRSQELLNMLAHPVGDEWPNKHIGKLSDPEYWSNSLASFARDLRQPYKPGLTERTLAYYALEVEKMIPFVRTTKKSVDALNQVLAEFAAGADENGTLIGRGVDRNKILDDCIATLKPLISSLKHECTVAIDKYLNCLENRRALANAEEYLSNCIFNMDL